VYGEDVAGSRYYFAFDGLGSVVGLFDSSGSLVSNYVATYEPYGKLVGAPPTGYPAFNYRFASYWFDTQTGLYKVGARYYDPALGRWTQRDPIDNPFELHGWNRYIYAGDDPINDADPTGLRRCSSLSTCYEYFKHGLPAAHAWKDAMDVGEKSNLIRFFNPEIPGRPPTFTPPKVIFGGEGTGGANPMHGDPWTMEDALLPVWRHRRHR
jgi:RHS repeat-associated protein